MEKVTVFLRTSLFSFGGPDPHVPPGVMVIQGAVLGRPAGGLSIETSRMLDDRGRVVSEATVRLELPWSKVDHLWVHEAS